MLWSSHDDLTGSYTKLISVTPQEEINAGHVADKFSQNVTKSGARNIWANRSIQSHCNNMSFKFKQLHLWPSTGITIVPYLKAKFGYLIWLTCDVVLFHYIHYIISRGKVFTCYSRLQPSSCGYDVVLHLWSGTGTFI